MTYDFLFPGMKAGGAERISLYFARILKRHGHQVRLINLYNTKGGMSGWLEKDEFEVVTLGCSRSLSAISALRKYLKAHRSDIVFTSLESSAIAALIACRGTDIPVILRLPNMPRNNLRKGLKALKIRIVKWAIRRLFHRAQAVIAQTEEMRTEAIAYYGLPEDKVVTIYNPLDAESVRRSAAEGENPFATSGPRFLSVGTIDYRKGFDTLLEAFSKVKSRLSDATLTIVGDKGSDYAHQLTDKWAGADGVDFCGYKKSPYPYMAHCDVFVLPSRMEGFPNVLLEAMCLDKPVVATTCLPVINQIVNDGQNGYICPVDAPDQLADRMIDALRLGEIHNTYHLFDEVKMLQLFEIDHKKK